MLDSTDKRVFQKVNGQLLQGIAITSVSACLLNSEVEGGLQGAGAKGAGKIACSLDDKKMNIRRT